MKLNPDCIREILFAIEELSLPNSIITSNNLKKKQNLSKYSDDEILYHLQQLDWSGYIITPKNNKCLDGTFFINDLSPIGHEFISDIRQDNNWNKVKSIGKEVGTSTLSSFKTIAEELIACGIKSAIGLK